MADIRTTSQRCEKAWTYSILVCYTRSIRSEPQYTGLLKSNSQVPILHHKWAFREPPRIYSRWRHFTCEISLKPRVVLRLSHIKVWHECQQVPCHLDGSPRQSSRDRQDTPSALVDDLPLERLQHHRDCSVIDLA